MSLFPFHATPIRPALLLLSLSICTTEATAKSQLADSVRNAWFAMLRSFAPTVIFGIILVIALIQ